MWAMITNRLWFSEFEHILINFEDASLQFLKK